MIFGVKSSRWLTAMILWVTLVSITAHTRESRSVLRVMTFNLRRDFPVDSPNHWSARKAFAAELIRRNRPDVLGTQELTVDQLQDLAVLLPGYSHFGVGRKDGKTKSEYSAIFFRSDKYKLLQSATFWLSPTPDVIGSVGWDAVLPRIVTWGQFEEIKSGKCFFFFNTHFDHKGVIARDSSAVLLLRKVNEIAASAPAFITGDLNSTPESSTLRLLSQGMKQDHKILNPLLLTSTQLKPVWTFDGFGTTPVESRERIDYIFGFQPVRMLSYRHIRQTKGPLYASDHLAVLASFGW